MNIRKKSSAIIKQIERNSSWNFPSKSTNILPSIRETNREVATSIST